MSYIKVEHTWPISGARGFCFTGLCKVNSLKIRAKYSLQRGSLLTTGQFCNCISKKPGVSEWHRTYKTSYVF